MQRQLIKPTAALQLVQKEKEKDCSTLEALQLLKDLEADHIRRGCCTRHRPPACRPLRVSSASKTRNLAPYDLTKAEKLQVVKSSILPPLNPSSLRRACYSCPSPRSTHLPPKMVEELEHRLGNSLEEVLDVVRSSLTAPPHWQPRRPLPGRTSRSST
jgi:hypothetical protein